jgi:hypothetical protein
VQPSIGQALIQLPALPIPDIANCQQHCQLPALPISIHCNSIASITNSIQFAASGARNMGEVRNHTSFYFHLYFVYLAYREPATSARPASSANNICQHLPVTSAKASDICQHHLPTSADICCSCTQSQ